jgi:hypothetical protein
MRVSYLTCHKIKTHVKQLNAATQRASCIPEILGKRGFRKNEIYSGLSPSFRLTDNSSHLQSQRDGIQFPEPPEPWLPVPGNA